MGERSGSSGLRRVHAAARTSASRLIRRELARGSYGRARGGSIEGTRLLRRAPASARRGTVEHGAAASERPAAFAIERSGSDAYM